MIGYILDYHTFAVKDIVEVAGFSAVTDTSYKQTSTVTLAHKPNINKRDFVVCYDDAFNLRLTDAADEWLQNAGDYHLTMDPNIQPVVGGICQSIDEANETYSLTLGQFQTLFDRTVLSEDEDLREDGVELYLANLITRNFVSSGDSFVDLPYIEIHADTRTVYSWSLADKNGLVNITTAASTLLKSIGLRMDMTPLPGKLHIAIYKDSLAPIKLKSDTPDVVSFLETTDVAVTSKILVKWKMNDQNGQMGAITYPEFYLRSDRTVTMNAADPGRIDGQATVMYIQAPTIEDVTQKVKDQFTSNRYDHKAEISVLQDGLYRMSDYYAGRKAVLYNNGVALDSIISQINYSDASPAVLLTLGELPVTLTDKLRNWIHGELQS